MFFNNSYKPFKFRPDPERITMRLDKVEEYLYR